MKPLLPAKLHWVKTFADCVNGFMVTKAFMSTTMSTGLSAPPVRWRGKGPWFHVTVEKIGTSKKAVCSLSLE